MFILVWLTILKISSSLVIFESDRVQNQQNMSGIHFQNTIGTVVSNNDLSVCARVNYYKLNPVQQKAILFDFQVTHETSDSLEPFLWFFASYHPASWFGFHRFANWVLRELPDNYRIWTINIWHHVCLTFLKSKSKVVVVKVKVLFFVCM